MRSADVRHAFIVAAGAALGSAGAPALAADPIRIVGSSTVFPFATSVAEHFGRETRMPAPVVESTGTGGGFKLFCGGVGQGQPDITNASRQVKANELETCAQNGVREVTEVRIGYDGIVLANSDESGRLEISIPQLWRALAKEVPQGGELVANPNRTWSDVDPSLPDSPIEVYGPPPTSGTRDAFAELVMDAGCPAAPAYESLSEDEREAACRTIREDGSWINAGENDNLIVQRLEANRNTFGVFGFSFLDQNIDRLQGSVIDGEEPTFENIAGGGYPVSRSLFFYVKNAHVGVVPGLPEYIAEFTSEGAFGPGGYLADKGLIPLPEPMREQVRETARELEPVQL